MRESSTTLCPLLKIYVGRGEYFLKIVSTFQYLLLVYYDILRNLNFGKEVKINVILI